MKAQSLPAEKNNRDLSLVVCCASFGSHIALLFSLFSAEVSPLMFLPLHAVPKEIPAEAFLVVPSFCVEKHHFESVVAGQSRLCPRRLQKQRCVKGAVLQNENAVDSMWRAEKVCRLSDSTAAVGVLSVYSICTL